MSEVLFFGFSVKYYTLEIIDEIMQVHLRFICSHPDMHPHCCHLALNLIQLWQRGSRRSRRDCLLSLFGAIVLFPLLVVIYWGFIKTEWLRSQPGSINCSPPPRQPKSTLSPALPLCLYRLLLFLLSLFPLSPLISSPLWRNLSHFNLQLRVGGVGTEPMWLCRLFCVGAS